MRNMKNEKLEKAFKNIAKTATEARPSLQCLHVDKSGYAVVTDSHRLLRIDNYKDSQDNTTEYNLNLLNFQLCNDLNYPETDRLIPTTFKFKWSFSEEAVTTLATFFKPFKIKKNSNDASLVTITYKDNHVTFTAASGATITVENSEADNENSDNGDKMEMLIQGGYLAQAFEFFKDYGDSVSIGYNGDTSPLLMNSGDASYLVTPVRKF